jgi:hypothetical protein
MNENVELNLQFDSDFDFSSKSSWIGLFISNEEKKSITNYLSYQYVNIRGIENKILFKIPKVDINNYFYFQYVDGLTKEPISSPVFRIRGILIIIINKKKIIIKDQMMNSSNFQILTITN